MILFMKTVSFAAAQVMGDGPPLRLLKRVLLVWVWILPCAVILAMSTAVFAQTGSSTKSELPDPAARCSDILKTSFKPDELTSVIAVKRFSRGEALSDGSFLEGKALAELCMVRLLVRPGNPGPAGAPSTSQGIGIEVWLPSPSSWTGRLHLLGGGGSSARPIPGDELQIIAAVEGSVSAVTDAGHSPFITQKAEYTDYADGSFMLDPNGKISRAQWRDFGQRGIHEMAVKTKELAAWYYGRAPTSSYFSGASGGGRQGLMEAQKYPGDFNGILVGMPAINWTRLGTAMIYPQVVMQRDLSGTPLTPDQLKLASAAAVSACDTLLNGTHDGFISDPAACNYNPVEDRSVLCTNSGGLNETPACLTKAQARALNKMWYGQTADGSVPDPAVDNGDNACRLVASQLWFGIPRGGVLAGARGTADSKDGKAVANPLASGWLATVLQNPKLGSTAVAPLRRFSNASGNGEDGWRTLTYADLAHAQAVAARLEDEFGPWNGNDPDLTRFKARGGKLIMFQGMADQAVPPCGTTNYYDQVTSHMGSLAATQDFFRYFLAPGMGHGLVSVDGLSGVSPPADPPLPDPRELYGALVNWVEKGTSPEGFVMWNSRKSVSRPLCVYPKKVVYRGGNTAAAASYACF